MCVSAQRLNRVLAGSTSSQNLSPRPASARCSGGGSAGQRRTGSSCSSS